MNIASPALEYLVSSPRHGDLAEKISALIEEAAKEPGVALAQRSPDYIREKLNSGKAVLCLEKKGESSNVVGFCYIETWSDGRYVANSGLTVRKEYRAFGVGKKLKEKAFELSRQKYPHAKLFGLTTNPAVMKINSSLGYRPTSYRELTQDEQFWAGCVTCPYHDILTRLKREMCLCTAMVFDPERD